MNTALSLRQVLMKDAHEIAQLYVDAAQGKATFMRTLPEARKEVWSLIKDIIAGSSDPLPLAKLTDGDISERVDAVLGQVAEGVITPEDGKRLIGLLQAGFEITELPKLLERFEEASNQS